MSPLHHAPDELLMAYAAGGLGEAQSLALATHLALCLVCRGEVRRLETLGGVLLDDLPAPPVDEDLLTAFLNRLDAPGGEVATLSRSCAKPAAAGLPVLPQPLRGYVGGDLDQVAWTRILPGLAQATVPVRSGTARARLLRVAAGTALPRRTHAGTELTLVLSGGYSDGDRHFQRGDLDFCDGSVDHRPMAGESGECVCLLVTDAPLRLTGPTGRLLNSFLRL